MDDQAINYFGLTDFRNQERKFGIKKNDRRKHMYIVGKTGMGKTTLLENLAMQDIRNGEGLAFIDPHGDTAWKLLDFVPRERINDVIYFDPADTAFPIGLNVMENVDPERRHFVASGLMGVFKKTFGPDVWSARMEYILGNTVLALLEYPGSTLLSVNPMLAVKEFRKKVVEHMTDPVVKAFWTQEFAKYTERFAAEATPAIQNKIGQFTSNALIRNIIGQQKSTFDFRKIMDEKKIFIINLAKGRVGEDTARLLGAMIVTKLYLAAMSRVDEPDESKRSDFFLYVDEFQNFATESFANILSEARKYRLSLTLAHQYMAQLAEEVRDAVIGNVGTILTFRVGAEDAEFLEKELTPEFMATDVVNLGFAQVYLKLMIDGVASRPFSARTLPPILNPEQSYREQILEASRRQYGRPRAEVENHITDWSTELETESVSKERSGTSRDGASGAPARPLFDATCIVCNKKIQVPFEPDPTRPVFCKDHMGLAAKYPPRLAHSSGEAGPPRLAHSSGEAGPPRLPQREERKEQRDASQPRITPASPSLGGPGRGEFVSRRPERTMSLNELGKTASPPRREAPQNRVREEKQNNLSALREALKKSLENKPQNPTDETKKAVSSIPSNQNKNATIGTLKPGEKIEI